jgi:exopolysaccharide biosynthesis polyprenyl glycosylphosphotransferase
MFQANTFGRANVVRKNVTENLNIAILGINHIAAKLYKYPDYIVQDGQQIVGFINTEPATNNHNPAQFPNVLGEINEIRQIVSQYRIGKVVLAIDPRDREKLHEVIEKCEREKINYEVLPEAYDGEYKPACRDYEPEIAGLTEEWPEPQKEPWFQRVLDIIIGNILFLLFLPSWIVVAIAIKLESPGGVLYTQERRGQGGKVFKIYKFRSMYINAERMNGPQLATRNDPRITKVGNIIRKTRVDELPQLFNVIKGEMSLVGPRPERPYFVEKYREMIPRYMKRLSVKPGLTGYAQVESGYDETIEDVKKKLQYDLYYIEQQHSFILYMRILFKTLWVVLSARGQ